MLSLPIILPPIALYCTLLYSVGFRQNFHIIFILFYFIFLILIFLIFILLYVIILFILFYYFYYIDGTFRRNRQNLF